MDGSLSVTEIRPGCELVADIYARVSTLPQANEESLNDQVRYTRAGLAAWGLREGMVWQETYSAASRRRPVLDQMMTRVASGQVGAVVVLVSDRFIRDQIGLNVLLETFRLTGVRLISIKEHIDSGTEYGTQIWNNFAFTAEMERKRIFDRTMQGKLTKAEGGKVPTACGGGSIYGYDYDKNTKAFTVNDTEYAVIRQIVADVLAGESLHGIVGKLNASGVPAPKGGDWRVATVSRMLGKTTYTGTYLAFAKRPSSRNLRSFPSSTWAAHWQGNPDPIPIHGVFPPIISLDEASIIRDRLDQNRRNARRNDCREYFLRGLVTCERCGHRYIGSFQRHRSGREYYHYRCGNRKCKGAPMLRMNETDARAWDELVAFLTDEDRVDATLSRLAAGDSARIAEREIAAIRSAIANTTKRNQNLIDVLESDGVDAFTRGDLKGRMAQLAEQRARLNQELETAERNYRALALTREQIVRAREACAAMRALLPGLERGEKRQIMQDIGARFRVTAAREIVLVIGNTSAVAFPASSSMFHDTLLSAFASLPSFSPVAFAVP